MEGIEPMTRLKMSTIILIGCVAIALSFVSPAEAKKPDKPGGGGGGEPPPRFTVLELPLEGYANAISETDQQGTITVAVDGSDAGYASAAFARVDRLTKEILDYGFLPEPPFVDRDDGQFKDGPSGPSDVNDDRTIVGSASAFEEDPDYTGSDPSPNRGVVWTYDGTDYSYEVLPTLNLAPTYTSGINNWGAIVGSSDHRAVLWDAFTHDIEDLNTAETAALGWELRAALDINDDGLVVGIGLLNEKTRGFLLDLNSGDITPVPLIGSADQNGAYRINANGRLVGYAWDGDGASYGTNPDYVRGYSWDGPGSDPVVLPSVTNNTSHAFGLNDFGASTGISIIPNDDVFSNNLVPTLWEFDTTGNLTATELATEIPNKPDWYLHQCWDINNDGWISARGRKFFKGRYVWPALLLVPNQ